MGGPLPSIREDEVQTLKRTQENPEIAPVDLCTVPAALCKVTLRTSEHGLVLEVQGSLDGSCMPALSAQFDQLQCTPCEEAILDMTRVSVVDHVGLNAIAGLAHYVAARGGRFLIRCAPGAIRGLLISTGLGPHLEVASSRSPMSVSVASLDA